MPGEGGSLDGGAVGPGEDVAARLPVCPHRVAFLALPFAVLFEGAQAWRGQGDAPFRAWVLVARAVRPLVLVVRRASSNSALSR